MTRRRSISIMGLVAAALAGALSLHGQAQNTTPRTAAPPQTPMVISEVLFDPRPGDSAFVELLNTGSAPLDLSQLAVEINDFELSLIRVTEMLPAGARLLVQFDEQGRLEGRTLHAPKMIALPSESGRVALVGGDAEAIDAVSWGDEDEAIDRGADDIFAPAPAKGRTIGRPPGATRPHNLRDWIVYAPADATPGGENPLPRVMMLVPFSGSIVKAAVRLSWYPVTGARSYRVQLARDGSFASPVLERVVADTESDAGTLPTGPYFWRVQSIDKTGKPAAYSDASRFEVDPSMFSSPPPVPPFAMRIQSRQFPPGTRTPDGYSLGVPELKQHKDTRMLQLENADEHDPHGWDLDHKEYKREPSDSHNCVVASVAMVNHYYGGDLSQDRIAYEVKSKNAQKYVAAVTASPRFQPQQVMNHLREKKPGPEWDLNYGDGLVGGQMAAAIAFAFTARGAAIDGSRVGLISNSNRADPIWNTVRNEIENNRPLLDSIGHSVGTDRHMVVIHGWGIRNGKRYLHKIDPIRGLGFIDLDGMSDTERAKHIFFLLPQNPAGRRQELEVTMDSDSDGVVDFDETERFQTDPKDFDTDRDGVLDKKDVASGVFDQAYGYAEHNTSTKGRDYDGDSVPTERDRDSDDGGCRDGVEDTNGSGHVDARETWNFDERDDVCRDINGRIVTTTVVRWNTPLRQFQDSTFVLTVALTPERPGEMGPLVDNGSRYRFRAVGVLEIPDLKINGCHPIARQSSTGAGAFARPDDIGGNISEDELVVGAIADGQGRATTDMCIFSGTSRVEASASLGDCTGHREVAAGTAYVFDCTTPPANLPAGMQVRTWSTQGRVTLDVKVSPDLMAPFPRRPNLQRAGLPDRPVALVFRRDRAGRPTLEWSR